MDLTSLIGRPDSYLQGKLSEAGDVDYYDINLRWYRALSMAEQYNQDITITLDHIPEGCDYELILYDENGNQVGIGKDNGQGRNIINFSRISTSLQDGIPLKAVSITGLEIMYRITSRYQIYRKRCCKI